jgi:hypothetical protein
MTRQTTLGQLAVGDIVYAIAGKPRTFPWEVTRVDLIDVKGVVPMACVRFWHGGIVPPCDASTPVTVEA